MADSKYGPFDVAGPLTDAGKALWDIQLKRWLGNNVKTDQPPAIEPVNEPAVEQQQPVDIAPKDSNLFENVNNKIAETLPSPDPIRTLTSLKGPNKNISSQIEQDSVINPGQPSLTDQIKLLTDTHDAQLAEAQGRQNLFNAISTIGKGTNQMLSGAFRTGKLDSSGYDAIAANAGQPVKDVIAQHELAANKVKQKKADGELIL